MKRKPRRNFVKVVRDGDVLAVVRPSDPALALKLSRAAKNQEDFDAVLAAQVGYRFMGILANDVSGTRAKIAMKTVIVHPITMRYVGDLQAGDSFVTYDSLLQANPNLLEQLKSQLH